MPAYKLYYFNGRGLAEVSRLIFTAAGEKFEDIRYERDDWPAHKAEMPLGQMPLLEVDGFRLPQSASIARFLAKRFHLAGKDDLAHAKVDAVVDTLYDALKAYLPARFEQDEAKQKALSAKFFDEELPKFLKNLEILGKMYGNGGHFFVDNELTWADLVLYNFGETFLQGKETCLDEFAWLKQNRAEVAKNPKIAEYLKHRPQTQF